MPILLQINPAKNVLSTGKIVEQIGMLAEENGWKCYIASASRYTRSGKIEHIKIGGIVSEYFHAFFYSTLLDMNGLGSYFATKRLIKKIKRIKPDVIHLHNLHGHYVNYKLIFNFLKESNIPVVWTLHDCWSFTGGCSYFEFTGCEGWKHNCKKCTYKGGYPMSTIVNRASRNYALKKELFTSIDDLTIVAVSKWLGHLASQSFLRKFPIKTIYNGIDTEVFVPSKSTLRDRLGLNGKFVMIAVASVWIPEKGLNDYIKLSNMLKNDEQLILVGITTEIKKELPSNILAIAKISNQKELAEYYSMSDVLLNLSYQETFGLTTIEAMACGTPAIVYNKTASPELITPETGFLVEAGDMNCIRCSIDILKTEGKRKYTSACKKRANEYFSKKVCYQKYIDLYNHLIS